MRAARLSTRPSDGCPCDQSRRFTSPVHCGALEIPENGGMHMSSESKALVSFSVDFLKYYVRLKLGPGPHELLLEPLGELAKDAINSEVERLLPPKKIVQKVRRAFEKADDCMRQASDIRFRELIASQPLGDLPKLERLASHLVGTFDDLQLLAALKQQFKEDWGGRLTELEYGALAREYRDCLDRALASEGEIQGVILRTVQRTGRDLAAVSADIKDIKSAVTVPPDKEAEAQPDYGAYLDYVIASLRQWQRRYAPMFAKFKSLTLFARVTVSCQNL
jgi:hypothetical protein